MTAKEKMTAPVTSVGADVEQPLQNFKTNQSIADLPGKGNLQATNNAENTAKSAKSNKTFNVVRTCVRGRVIKDLCNAARVSGIIAGMVGRRAVQLLRQFAPHKIPLVLIAACTR